MTRRAKISVVTLVIAVPAFFLGPQIWPPAMTPPGNLIPFYAFLAALESLLFGLGVYFLFAGFPMVSRLLPEKKRLARLAHLALTWQLISWWPHDNLHAHIGMDFVRLLGIEYGFHLTLMISSVTLAYTFWVFLRQETGVGSN